MRRETGCGGAAPGRPSTPSRGGASPSAAPPGHWPQDVTAWPPERVVRLLLALSTVRICTFITVTAPANARLSRPPDAMSTGAALTPCPRCLAQVSTGGSLWSGGIIEYVSGAQKRKQIQRRGDWDIVTAASKELSRDSNPGLRGLATLTASLPGPGPAPRVPLGRGVKGGVGDLIPDPENEGMDRCEDFRAAEHPAGSAGHHTLQQPAASLGAD